MENPMLENTDNTRVQPMNPGDWDKLKTRAENFTQLGTSDSYLFQVCEGVSARDALSTSQCLTESVQRLMDLAVEEGMSAEVAWLCSFAIEASTALRSAAGAEV